MDFDRVAALRRYLGSVPSRREILRGLAGAGLGVAAARLPDVVEAKKKRKHKSKKPKPNEFGCLSVGIACKSEDQCCSGICEGTKGKKQCRNHGAGTCSQVVEGFCTSSNPTQVLCNNRSDDCVCVRTTAGSNFCAQVGDEASECAECTTDADCEALRFPRGSACAPMTEGRCADMCRGNRICLVPCSVPPPPRMSSR